MFNNVKKAYLARKVMYHTPREYLTADADRRAVFVGKTFAPVNIANSFRAHHITEVVVLSMRCRAMFDVEEIKDPTTAPIHIIILLSSDLGDERLKFNFIVHRDV